jgi:gamma-glutamyltranspeptidase/glutathione hydrolase
MSLPVLIVPILNQPELLTRLVDSIDHPIDLPNFGTVEAPVLLEKGRFPATTVESLQMRGHRVVQTDLPTGAQAVQRVPGGLAGGADPRKEGVARGD